MSPRAVGASEEVGAGFEVGEEEAVGGAACRVGDDARGLRGRLELLGPPQSHGRGCEGLHGPPCA